MAGLKEMLQRQAALERQIEELRVQARAAALAEARRLVREHALSAADLADGASGGARRPVAPRYRDPATGATWSGRGLRPRWVRAALEAGGSLDELRVDGEPR